VFYGVFTAEEFCRDGDKGSRDTTVVDVRILQEAFLNVSLSFACFSSEEFFGNTLPKCWYISISRWQIKGILLYLQKMHINLEE
jgi:hypothetical protein